MTTTPITSHVYRPQPNINGRQQQPANPYERPCEYMNCHRPRTEHAQSVTRWANRKNKRTRHE